MFIASWLRSLSRLRRRAYHLSRREPRRLLARRRLFECLEGRQLLASDWQNAFVSTDVNNDRNISPLDALLVINKLNVNHGEPLPPLASGVKPSAYYDTSGDGVLSALDALRVINSLNAPTNQLTDIHALSNHYVMATFTTSAADVLMFPENFHLTGPSAQRLDVVSVVKGNSPNQLILTTADQAGLNYTAGFASAAKISMPSAMSLAGLVSGTYYGPADNVTPRLIDFVPISKTSVLATYDRAMSASAIDPANYSIIGEDGQSIDVLSAQFASGESVVELQTAPQSNSSYTVNIQKVSALGSLAVTSLEVAFYGIGSRPTLVAVTSNWSDASDGSHMSTVLMTFSEALSDDALASGAYTITNAEDKSILGIIGTPKFIGDERRLVELTTAEQLGGLFTVEKITARDPDGNTVVVPGNPMINQFQGFDQPTGPLLHSAAATDTTHVYLTFAGPVGDSALSPSSFTIETLDDQGNPSGNLVISSSEFVGSQRNFIALTTHIQSAAKYRISTTPGLTDTEGSGVQVSSLEFQGVANQASLVTISSTSSSTVLLTFSMSMSEDALSPSLYSILDSASPFSPLPIFSAQFVGTEHRLVELTTGPQTALEYKVKSINATDMGGGTAIIIPSSPINTFKGPVTNGGSSVPNAAPPRVVGAASLSNTTVLVAFSEPMSANVLNKENYVIVQQNVNSEVGYVSVASVDFFDKNKNNDQRSVLLTTSSQNELTYSVTVLNVTDLGGTALAASTAAGQRDPATALFPGTPPSGQMIDSDQDGLSDSVEVRGWVVNVIRLDGTTANRQVTSDPLQKDSDLDGLTDTDELRLGIDPRSADTDGDQLTDYSEFNEIFSSPNSQDSDGDSLDDYAEFQFFKTSPYLADSDGDQLRDDYEIFANRNPRVSDLPRPEITVGQISLQLDVRFEETHDQQRRDLESKSVSATLSKSVNAIDTHNNTQTVEGHFEAGYGNGAVTGFLNVGVSGGGTWVQNGGSETLTQQAYLNSLSTDHEVTDGFNVVRHVEGAVMQVAIDLRNLSSLAYRVKNLQVTAFMQDPQDHSRLTPVATLLPDSEPAEGFTLGPLVQNRGPFNFSNTTIIPSLVESFMANPSGLIFRISNYDIVDESGRNFAFSSQEIVERTSTLIIDYGGGSSLRAALGGQPFDELKSGDESEIHHVATSAGNVIDTNSDGEVDKNDRRAIFDANGKEVGITIFDAFAAIGLTRYDESTKPTQSLTPDQILSSFSTRMEYFKGTAGATVPNSTDVKNESVKFKTDPNLAGGTLVRVTQAGGGLEEGHNYFVGKVGGSYKFYDTKENAITPNNPINLTSDILAGIFIPSVPAKSTPVTSTVTFNPDVKFPTGTVIRVTSDSAGLVASAEYFIRNDGTVGYSFYNTAADALAATNRVTLTGQLVAGIFGTAARGVEKIFRIRGLSNDTINDKYWEIMTASGINKDTGVNQLILKSNAFVNLNYVQDLDGDGLSADVENFLGTSDSPLPFGANVPNSSNSSSISFNTDPDLETGTLVRVSSTGNGLAKGMNYFVRNLGSGSYSFFDTLDKLVQLTAEFKAGIYVPSVPVTTYNKDSTDNIKSTISFDPGFATGDLVSVSVNGGGLTTKTDYYVRNLGGGNYSFYDKLVNANADAANTTGRINLTDYVVSRITKADAPKGYNPVSTNFVAQSVSFDPNFATGTLVKVTAPTGGSTTPKLKSNLDYTLKNEGKGLYSFYFNYADAIAGKNRIPLTGEVTAGVFSSTAKGQDTDRDGLDDRFESLIGWNVSTPQQTYHVYSSPTRRDSNFDNPNLGVDSDNDGTADQNEYDGSDFNAAPSGWNDKISVDTTGDGIPDVPNGLRDQFEVSQLNAKDFVLDPVHRDTDGDGINDATEIIGFQTKRLSDSMLVNYTTNPLTPFTDSDTFTDGFEKLVGLDPTDGRDTDNDGDGLPDLIETTGWRPGKLVSFSAVQKIEVGVSGDFQLQYGANVSTPDNTTSLLSVNAPAGDLELALNNLKIIRDLKGIVAVTREGLDFFITFGGELATHNQPELHLTGTSLAERQGLDKRTSERQQLNFILGTDKTQLKLGEGPSTPENTTSIFDPWTITAASLQTMLNAMPAIKSVGGSVIVSLQLFGNPVQRLFDISFGGALAGKVVDLLRPTGSNSNIVTSQELQAGFTVPAPQQFVVGSSGSFALECRYLQGGVIHLTTMTALLSTSASPTDVKQEIDKILTRFNETVEVTRTNNAFNVTFNNGSGIFTAQTLVLSVNDAAETIQEGSTSEVQRIDLLTTGTFQLQFGAGPSTSENITDPLTVFASASDLETLINNLKVVKDREGFVTVTRHINFTFKITFGGGLANLDIMQMIGTGTGFDKDHNVTTPIDGREVFPEVQKVSVQSSGTFRLQVGDGKSSEDNQTTELDVSTTASELEVALNGLKVLKDTNGLAVAKVGNDFRITFGGDLLENAQLLRATNAAVTRVRKGHRPIGIGAISTIANEDRVVASGIKYSSSESKDTDKDGLTDYEEFFLHTDPSSADSDSDGLDDRTEFLGYSLSPGAGGHLVGGKDLGIIKTDPLDADTDNDKRSDGDEAELKDIELQRWVVRVDGKTPLQVFSNPLVADADFDGLVDGDEFNFDALFPERHTDPNNGNTDGDAHNDLLEFTANTNPLVEDFLVTVYFSSINIKTSGDSSDPGDFGFDLGIRLPDNSQPGGLSKRFTSIVQSNVTLSAPFRSVLNRDLSELEGKLAKCTSNSANSLCNNGVTIESKNSNFGIPLLADDTLQFRSLLADEKRSKSFAMTKNDFFAIEGVVVEDDTDNPNIVKDRRVYLGGLEGLHANDSTVAGTEFRPVFYGADLIASASPFHDVIFNFTTNSEQFGTGNKFAGSVTVLFVIS